MRRRLLVQSVAAIGFLFFLLAGNPPDLQEALTRWEGLGRQVDYQELSALANVVRANTPRGDAAVIERLMAITQNPSQPGSSRAQALRVACALADSDGAKTIVEAFEMQMAAYRHAPREGESREEVIARIFDEAGVIHDFLEMSRDALLDKLPDHRRIHSLAVEAYLRGTALPWNKKVAIELILECQVSQEVMDSKIVEIVGRSRSPLPEALIDRISSAALVPLRELVRLHRTPGDFNYGAAGALAYLGDEEIKAVLNAMLPAAREHSEGAEARLLKFIWRIEVQHPPDKLLAYVSSVDVRGFRDSRSWAIQRAHKLGVEPKRIRGAILTHAANASTRLERADIPVLKMRGLELGILQPDDLPDVKIPVTLRETP